MKRLSLWTDSIEDAEDSNLHLMSDSVPDTCERCDKSIEKIQIVIFSRYA
jgi:hypothetical protein